MPPFGALGAVTRSLTDFSCTSLTMPRMPGKSPAENVSRSEADAPHPRVYGHRTLRHEWHLLRAQEQMWVPEYVEHLAALKACLALWVRLGGSEWLWQLAAADQTETRSAAHCPFSDAERRRQT